MRNIYSLLLTLISESLVKDKPMKKIISFIFIFSLFTVISGCITQETSKPSSDMKEYGLNTKATEKISSSVTQAPQRNTVIVYPTLKGYLDQQTTALIRKDLDILWGWYMISIHDVKYYTNGDLDVSILGNEMYPKRSADNAFYTMCNIISPMNAFAGKHIEPSYNLNLIKNVEIVVLEKNIDVHGINVYSPILTVKRSMTGAKDVQWCRLPEYPNFREALNANFDVVQWSG